MEGSTWLALVAAVGAIVAFWSQLRGFADRIVEFFVVTVELDDGWAVYAVTNYIFVNLTRSKFSGRRTYSIWEVFIRPLNKNQFVLWEAMTYGTVLFWKGWFPLWITRDKNDKPVDRQVKSYQGVTLKFLRFTFNSDKLLLDIVNSFNAKYQKELEKADKLCKTRFNVISCIGSGRKEQIGEKPYIMQGMPYGGGNRSVGWDEKDLGSKTTGVSLESLWLCHSAKTFVEEVKFWFTNEKWYRERNIAWRRGYLFHSTPGNGKTSLIRAIAYELNLPIYSFDLATLSNQEFKGYWKSMSCATPCVALLEDFDSVFNKRKNLSSSTHDFMPLTFDCLLNTVDGVEQSDGIILAITTNNLSSIDEAIAGDGTCSRPGRVDRVIHLENPDREGMHYICSKILMGFEDQWEHIIELGLSGQETAAQFQERCKRFAIKQLWKGLADEDEDIDQAIEEAKREEVAVE